MTGCPGYVKRARKRSMVVRPVFARCGEDYAFAGYANNRVGAAACFNHEIYFFRMLTGVRAKDVEICDAPCQACGHPTSAFVLRLNERK